MSDNIEPIIYPYTDRYGNEYEITFAKATYMDNGNLAVLMYNKEPDYGYWEDYATLTVNVIALDYPRAAIDTNNLGEDIVAWIEENDIAHDPLTNVQSGFCTYPIMDFNEEWLESIPTVE